MALCLHIIITKSLCLLYEQQDMHAVLYQTMAQDLQLALAILLRTEAGTVGSGMWELKVNGVACGAWLYN